MSDGGKTRPRARGEDPTATGFNPLYADGPAAATRGRRSASHGRKGLKAVAGVEETSVYAEVFPARSAEGGRGRCSSAELCGYLICPLTTVCLALGAFLLAVLLLTGVLRPLAPSKVLSVKCTWSS